MLGALAEALDLDRAVVDDMRLAVTEACTNVVRHAYADEEGTIDVIVRPSGELLEVVVTDEGRGLGPSPDTAGPGPGAGADRGPHPLLRGRALGPRGQPAGDELPAPGP